MRPKENGAALRRWRERRHYSQRQLAFLVGCSHAFIGLLERGQSTVGDVKAGKIARWLDVPVEELFEDRPVTRTPTVPTRPLAASRAA